MQPAFTEMLMTWAWSWVVGSSLFLLPACAGLVILRRWGPHVESLACRWILAGLLLVPASSALMQSMGWRGWQKQVVAGNTRLVDEALPTFARPTTQSDESSLIVKEANSHLTIDQAPEALRSSGISRAPISLRPYVSLVACFAWCAISIVLLVRVVTAWLAVQRLKRTAIGDEELQSLCQQLAASMHVPCPTVLRSAQVNGPCLVGAVRPVIFVPLHHIDSAADWSTVLLHELAHVHRRDVLWTWLFRLAIAAQPLQPLLWWLARRHETAAEQASDDLVVQRLDQPTAYAELLLDFAIRYQRSSAFGIGMSTRPSMLGQRIRRIMDQNIKRLFTISVRMRLALACLLGLQCALVSWVLLPASTLAAVAAQDAAPSAKHKGWLVSGLVIGVDGRPSVGASVQLAANIYGNFQHTLVTDAQGRFAYEMKPEHARISELSILARSADQQLLIYDVTNRPQKGSFSEPLNLQLEPTRVIEVEVVDHNDKRVASAKAAVKLPGAFQTAATDDKGVARFTVPQRQHIQSVAAWKNDLGFDCVAYEPPTSRIVGQAIEQPEFPVSGVQRLRLTGAKKLTVFVTDGDGQPISGMKVIVGQFQKPNSHSFATSWLETSTTERFSAPTDANGRTEFASIPEWHEGSLSFWPQSREYELKFFSHPIWSNEPVRMKLDRLVPVRGRVTKADGQPVEGVLVRAAGDVYASAHAEDEAITDKDGRYQLSLPPRHVYLIRIEDEALASEAKSIVLKPGQLAVELDFKLRAATRVFGRIVDRADGQPVNEAYVSVTQYGPRERSANTALPQEFADTSWNEPRLSQSVVTGVDGRYEFFLGDGDFDVHTHPNSSQTFDVREDSELEIPDIEVDTGIDFGGLTLSVDGKPLSKTNVEAWTTFGLEQWEAQSNEAGKFKVRRPKGSTTIRALAADGKHGAFESIDAEASSVVITLHPTGEATGRLVSASGQPLSKRTIAYGIRVTHKHLNFHPAAAPYTSIFNEAASTDEQGSFKLIGLVSNQEYYVTYYPNNDAGKGIELTKFKVGAGQSLKLGDVRVP